MNVFSNAHAILDMTPKVRILGEKQPAGRDGHSAIFSGDKWIVFGGDRHHMPYNDTYVLDLKRIIND